MTAYRCNINNFKNALSGDVQRTSRYFVMFTPPNNVDSGNSGLIVPALAQNVEMPGKEIVTTDWKHLGKTRLMPHYVDYKTVQFTFICDTDMKIKKMMDAWQNLIIDPNTYYFEYYDNYVSSCIVASLNENGIPTFITKLNEFWPRRVDAIKFDSKGGDYATIEVEFAYRDWSTKLSLLAANKDVSDFGLELDQFISTISGELNIDEKTRTEIRKDAERVINNLTGGYKFLPSVLPGPSFGLNNNILNLVQNLILASRIFTNK